jgi:hypothetical protein
MSFNQERNLPKTREGYGQNPRTSFWDHYDKDTNGCWTWRGGKNRQGQGVVRHQGRNWVTSRLAWTLTNGPIPSGMYICHMCDNPSRINPAHLFLGTPQDNSLDMYRKGRHPKRPKLKIWAVCHPERKYVARGMCSACYQRWWAHENT